MTKTTLCDGVLGTATGLGLFVLLIVLPKELQQCKTKMQRGAIIWLMSFLAFLTICALIIALVS